MTSNGFDCVLGNPPYQNPGKTKGNKLWYKFVFRNHELAKPGGVVAMVTPSSWIRGGINLGRRGVLKDVFGKQQLVSAHFREVNQRHFPEVGVDISWWICRKEPITQDTTLHLRDKTIQLNLEGREVMSPVPDSRAISILDKFVDPAREKEVVIYYHFKNPHRDREQPSPTESHPVPHWVYGCDEKNNTTFTYLPERFRGELDCKKILFLIGSRYWQPYLDMENAGVVAQGFAIPIRDEWTRQGIVSVYHSKLWRLIFYHFQLEQNGFMKNAIVKKTPHLDLSRAWTDEELYRHFGLTQEERDYIEATVK